MAEKEETERRVYVLPEPLLRRVRAYQTATGISSEVEAVRRLLDNALQMRDQIRDIMQAIRSRFEVDKDIRAVARDILAPHVQVKSVNFEGGALEFHLINGDGGKLYPWGGMEIYEDDFGSNNYHWSAWPPKKKPLATSKLPKDANGDDIPF